jgi:predicted transposase YbfD/YdcC
MAGCTSLAKVYRFSKGLSKKTRLRLGFTSNTPSHPTVTKAMKMIDPAEFEGLLNNLMSQVTGNNFKQIAIDGKSIRSMSSSKEGLLYLVSAFAPEVNAVLMQRRSEVAGGEIKSAEAMISKLSLEGKVITGDALYAQEVLCHKIVEAKGNYVFKVKRNKKRIIDDIDQGFNLAQAANVPIDSYEYSSKGHGRVDWRKIETISSNRRYFGGLGTIKQVARISKKSFNQKTGRQRQETQYLISSLLPDKANPAELLGYSVNHWAIENILHRSRDVVFKEDVCNIICSKSQQINTALRNLAIFLLSKINLSLTLAIEHIKGSFALAVNLICRRT